MTTSTTTTRNSLPTPIRFTAYLMAVAAFCFLNWTVLKAGDPVAYQYSEVEVENWMLGYDEVTVAIEELPVEDWMINYHLFTAKEEPEGEPEVRDRMVDRSAWGAHILIAGR